MVAKSLNCLGFADASKFLIGGDTVSTGIRRFVRRVGGVCDLVKTAFKTTIANDDVELAVAA